MQYGMTYHQYWNGDVYAHKHYRKAYRLKATEANTNAWIQGRYVYDALCAVSPILRAFSKAKKPADYPDEPYDLFADQRAKREENEAREKYERIKEKVSAFAQAFNEQRNSDGKEADDSGNSTGD